MARKRKGKDKEAKQREIKERTKEGASDPLEEKVENIQKRLENIREAVGIPKEELETSEKEESEEDREMKRKIRKKEEELERKGVTGFGRDYQMSQFKKKQRKLKKLKKHFPKLASQEEFQELSLDQKLKISQYGLELKQEELEEVAKKTANQGKTIEQAALQEKAKVAKDYIDEIEKKRDRIKKLEEKLQEKQLDKEEKKKVKKKIKNLERKSEIRAKEAEVLMEPSLDQFNLKK